MADFLSNLWNSVFTPGTTPTLLLATNATFALLQLLLFALLVATFSIHFLVLSVLSGGLWWSINWFAVELHAAQAKEEEAERLRKRRHGEPGDGGGGEEADDEGTETETEVEGRGVEGSVERRIREAMAGEESESGMGTGVEGKSGEVRARRVEEAERSGDVSGDSEWERVSQEGDQ